MEKIKKKIKITYFVPDYRGASMSRWVMGITQNIDFQKYAVSFAGLKMEESFKSHITSSVRVIELNNSYAPGILLKLVAYFRKDRPDIFVSAFPHINTVSVMAKIISRIDAKIILTEHNHFSLLVTHASSAWRRFFGIYILPRLMRAFYPLSDAVICVSRGVAESILAVVDVKDKIRVIYNLVISNDILRLAQEPVSHPWFLDQKVPIIVAAGRLVNQKDYPTLLKAFALVVQKKPVRLVILGEGPEQKKLENTALKFGISDGIAFFGFQKNPFKYMKKATVFVLSSLHEGFGNVIVEAMACGAPVISTDCKSGPGEIIENGKNGILVPVGDFKALSEAIIKVLTDSDLRKNLSLEGVKRSGDFSVQNGMRQYQEVFSNLTKTV